MSLGVVSIPSFESWLALHNDAKLNWHFLTVSLEKRDFFCKQHPNMDIFYAIEKYFHHDKNSRSLPQNKTPVGSDQLAKFCCFAQKYVLIV